MQCCLSLSDLFIYRFRFGDISVDGNNYKRLGQLLSSLAYMKSVFGHEKRHILFVFMDVPVDRDLVEEQLDVFKRELKKVVPAGAENLFKFSYDVLPSAIDHFPRYMERATQLSVAIHSNPNNLFFGDSTKVPSEQLLDWIKGLVFVISQNGNLVENLEQVPAVYYTLIPKVVEYRSHKVQGMALDEAWEEDHITIHTIDQHAQACEQELNRKITDLLIASVLDFKEGKTFLIHDQLRSDWDTQAVHGHRLEIQKHLRVFAMELENKAANLMYLKFMALRGHLVHHINHLQHKSLDALFNEVKLLFELMRKFCVEPASFKIATIDADDEIVNPEVPRELQGFVVGGGEDVEIVEFNPGLYLAHRHEVQPLKLDSFLGEIAATINTCMKHFLKRVLSDEMNKLRRDLESDRSKQSFEQALIVYGIIHNEHEQHQHRIQYKERLQRECHDIIGMDKIGYIQRFVKMFKDLVPSKSHEFYLKLVKELLGCLIDDDKVDGIMHEYTDMVKEADLDFVKTKYSMLVGTTFALGIFNFWLSGLSLLSLHMHLLFILVILVQIVAFNGSKSDLVRKNKSLMQGIAASFGGPWNALFNLQDLAKRLIDPILNNYMYLSAIIVLVVSYLYKILTQIWDNYISAIVSTLVSFAAISASPMCPNHIRMRRII
jgi:hypothetical protein